MPKKRLWRFRLGCGRMGELEGLFTATDEEVDAALGKRVLFGEVLGKYSDVQCVLGPEHLTRLDADEAFVAKFDELGCASGENPLEYLREMGG